MASKADILYALACASQLSGLPWDGKQPQTTFVDRDYLGEVGKQVDRNGNVVNASPKEVGAYFFGRDKAAFSNMADRSEVAHEMTHYLQDQAGMSPTKATADALANRKAIEVQAYDVQKRAPFECMGLLGNWKEDLKGK